MIDFTAWDQLLKRYANDQGQVNYQAWQQESSTTLLRWIRKTQAVLNQEHRNGAIATDNLQDDIQLATWINLYNALTIAQVLKHYPTQSIQPKILGITNWVGFLCFFMKPVYWFNHQSLSLNDIEHNILRKQFRDPRIHFALVCASQGCPLLRPEAYVPKRVQTQLEEDATRFINHPDKVRYDPQQHVLYCSKIFKWYRQDFLITSADIPNYVQRYWTGSELSTVKTVRYLSYDWALNQQDD